MKHLIIRGVRNNQLVSAVQRLTVGLGAVRLLILRLLKKRNSLILDETNLSERHRQYFYSFADWAIYQKMKPFVQKICHNHYSVNTSCNITPGLDKIVREVVH